MTQRGFALVIAGCPYAFHLGESAANRSTISTDLTWSEDLVIDRDISISYNLDTAFSTLEISDLQAGIINSKGYWNLYYNRNPLYTYLTSDIEYTDTATDTFTVESTTGLSNGDVIWIGGEAIKINVINSTTLEIVSRNYYKSLKEFHLASSDTTNDYSVVWFQFIGFDNRVAYLYRDAILIYKGIIAPNVRLQKNIIGFNILNLIELFREPLLLKRDFAPPLLQGFDCQGCQIELRRKGADGVTYATAINIAACNMNDTEQLVDYINSYIQTWDIDVHANLWIDSDGFYYLGDMQTSTAYEMKAIVPDNSIFQLLGFDAGEFTLPTKAPRPPARWGLILRETSSEYSFFWKNARTLYENEQFMICNETSWVILYVKTFSAPAVTFKEKFRGNVEKPIFCNNDKDEGIKACFYKSGTLKEALSTMISTVYGSQKIIEHVTSADYDSNSFEFLEYANLPPKKYILLPGDNIWDWIENEAKLSNCFVYIKDGKLKISPIKVNGVQTILHEVFGDEPDIETVEGLTNVKYSCNYNWAKQGFEKPDINVFLKDIVYNRGIFIKNSQSVEFKGISDNWTTLKDVLMVQGIERLSLLGRQSYKVTLEAVEDIEPGTIVALNGIVTQFIPYCVGVVLKKEAGLIGANKYEIWLPRINSHTWAPCCRVTSYNSGTGDGTCTSINEFTNSEDDYNDLTYLDPEYYSEKELPCRILQSNGSTIITQIINSVDISGLKINFSTILTAPDPPCYVFFDLYSNIYTLIDDIFCFVCDDVDRKIENISDGSSLL